jgi:hypothetical protein
MGSRLHIATISRARSCEAFSLARIDPFGLSWRDQCPLEPWGAPMKDAVGHKKQGGRRSPLHVGARGARSDDLT